MFSVRLLKPESRMNSGCLYKKRILAVRTVVAYFIIILKIVIYLAALCVGCSTRGLQSSLQDCQLQHVNF